jgi:hypothetical protein
VKGVWCRAGMGVARLGLIRPQLGTLRLAPGALGLQVTGPERGDMAVLVAVWSGEATGSWSGGVGELIGEGGRPGVLHKLLALSGARRSAWVTTGAEGEVGLRCLC